MAKEKSVIITTDELKRQLLIGGLPNDVLSEMDEELKLATEELKKGTFKIQDLIEIYKKSPLKEKVLKQFLTPTAVRLLNAIKVTMLEFLSLKDENSLSEENLIYIEHCLASNSTHGIPPVDGKPDSEIKFIIENRIEKRTPMALQMFQEGLLSFHAISKLPNNFFTKQIYIILQSSKLEREEYEKHIFKWENSPFGTDRKKFQRLLNEETIFQS